MVTLQVTRESSYVLDIRFFIIDWSALACSHLLILSFHSRAKKKMVPTPKAKPKVRFFCAI